jgi:hypothetical protein
MPVPNFSDAGRQAGQTGKLDVRFWVFLLNPILPKSGKIKRLKFFFNLSALTLLLTLLLTYDMESFVFVFCNLYSGRILISV